MKKLYTEESVEKIADAIRDKLKETRRYKLSEMADAIKRIQTGGSGGRNLIFVTDENENKSSYCPHGVDTIWLYSDTVLKKDISLSDITSDFVTGVVFINRLLLKLTLDQEKVVEGADFSISLKPSAYQDENGTSPVCTIPVANTLSLFDHTDIGKKTIADNYIDSGTCTVPAEAFGVISFENLAPELSKERTVIKSVSISGDSLITVGDSTIGVNNRDNAYQKISITELPMDDGCISMTKISWDGYMPYNRTDENKAGFDIFFLGNGDFYIRIDHLGTNDTGSFQMNEISFTNPGSGGYVTFYRQDYYGTRFLILNGMYDISKHNRSSESAVRSISADDYLTDTAGLSYLLKSDVDDATYTLTNGNFSFPLAGKSYSTFYISTNSWLGIKGSEEDIKINRKDAKAHLILHGNYRIKEWDITCYKIRWEGYDYYSNNSTVNQIWELYLFSNGDAMIQMEKKSSSDGTFSFFGTVFDVAEGGYVSFYKNSESDETFTVIEGAYDINQHLKGGGSIA